jgi:hypothetical protein
LHNSYTDHFKEVYPRRRYAKEQPNSDIIK